MSPHAITLIESAQNPRFKRFKELQQSKGIKEQGQFMLLGQKLTREVVKANPEKVVELISSPQTRQNRESAFQDLLDHNRIKEFCFHERLFKEIDFLGTHSDILLCENPKTEVWTAGDPVEGLEIVVPIGDPSNLGALLRSALAFQVDKIVLLQESAHVAHPRSIRALASNPFQLRLMRGPSLASLSPEKLLAWSLGQNGESISKFKWPRNIRLLVGEEGPGLDERFLQERVLTIPISSQVESLNATVALSVALFSYRRQYSLN